MQNTWFKGTLALMALALGLVLVSCGGEETTKIVEVPVSGTDGWTPAPQTQITASTSDEIAKYIGEGYTTIEYTGSKGFDLSMAVPRALSASYTVIANNVSELDSNDSEKIINPNGATIYTKSLSIKEDGFATAGQLFVDGDLTLDGTALTAASTVGVNGNVTVKDDVTLPATITANIIGNLTIAASKTLTINATANNIIVGGTVNLEGELDGGASTGYLTVSGDVIKGTGGSVAATFANTVKVTTSDYIDNWATVLAPATAATKIVLAGPVFKLTSDLSVPQAVTVEATANDVIIVPEGKTLTIASGVAAGVNLKGKLTVFGTLSVASGGALAVTDTLIAENGKLSVLGSGDEEVLSATKFSSNKLKLLNGSADVGTDATVTHVLPGGSLVLGSGNTIVVKTLGIQLDAGSDTTAGGYIEFKGNEACRTLTASALVDIASGTFTLAQANEFIGGTTDTAAIFSVNSGTWNGDGEPLFRIQAGASTNQDVLLKGTHESNAGKFSFLNTVVFSKGG
jgi:hypothetical protein